MTIDGGQVLGWSLDIATLMLSAGLLLCLVRVVLGPSLPDRIVALDLISIIAIGLITVYAIETQEAVLIDAAIVLALVAFLGTVTFARYLERITRE